MQSRGTSVVEFVCIQYKCIYEIVTSYNTLYKIGCKQILQSYHFPLKNGGKCDIYAPLKNKRNILKHITSLHLKLKDM